MLTCNSGLQHSCLAIYNDDQNQKHTCYTQSNVCFWGHCWTENTIMFITKLTIIFILTKLKYPELLLTLSVVYLQPMCCGGLQFEPGPKHSLWVLGQENVPLQHLFRVQMGTWVWIVNQMNKNLFKKPLHHNFAKGLLISPGKRDVNSICNFTWKRKKQDLDKLCSCQGQKSHLGLLMSWFNYQLPEENICNILYKNYT